MAYQKSSTGIVAGNVSFMSVTNIAGISSISPFPAASATNIFGGQVTITNPLTVTANLLVLFTFGEVGFDFDNGVYNLAIRGVAKDGTTTVNTPGDYDRRFQRQIAGDDRFSLSYPGGQFQYTKTLAAGASATFRLQYDWDVVTAATPTTAGSLNINASTITVMGVAQ